MAEQELGSENTDRQKVNCSCTIQEIEAIEYKQIHSLQTTNLIFPCYFIPCRFISYTFRFKYNPFSITEASIITPSATEHSFGKS